MSWIALVLFVLPLVVFALVARRVIRLARLMRDPEQLRSLFSEEVRAAMAREGLDPETVSLEVIQEHPELATLVGNDLRRALRASIFGSRRGAEAGASRALFRTRPAPEVGGSDAGHPSLPPPLHAASGGGGLRALALVAIAALVAMAFWLSL